LSGSERLLLFHGTSDFAAQDIVVNGFRAPDVAGRLRVLAERYDVPYEALSSSDVYVPYLWHRSRHVPAVHLATTRKLAADYAGRGSEIDHMGLQAIYFLQNPSAPKKGKGWFRAPQEWAKAEAALIARPMLVRLEIPLVEASDAVVEKVRESELLAELVGSACSGDEVVLAPEVASRWVAGLEEVSPAP
jgi:hypothetical protein